MGIGFPHAILIIFALVAHAVYDSCDEDVDWRRTSSCVSVIPAILQDINVEMSAVDQVECSRRGSQRSDPTEWTELI